MLVDTRLGFLSLQPAVKYNDLQVRQHTAFTQAFQVKY